jgi:hypothetical protein
MTADAFRNGTTAFAAVWVSILLVAATTSTSLVS